MFCKDNKYSKKNQLSSKTMINLIQSFQKPA